MPDSNGLENVGFELETFFTTIITVSLLTQRRFVWTVDFYLQLYLDILVCRGDG